jgi:hypothetical protein
VTASYGCHPCGENFGTLTLFDWHQGVDYNRPVAVSCLSINKIVEAGLVRDARGVWQTPEGLLKRAALAARTVRKRG